MRQRRRQWRRSRKRRRPCETRTAQACQAGGGAAAEEDVHIVREALRLLVACSHSPAEGGAAGSAQEPQAARLPADLPSLREWVAAMLLRCRVPEVREEACAALYALARDDFAAEHPSSPPQAGGGGAAPGCCHP